MRCRKITQNVPKLLCRWQMDRQAMWWYCLMLGLMAGSKQKLTSQHYSACRCDLFNFLHVLMNCNGQFLVNVFLAFWLHYSSPLLQTLDIFYSRWDVVRKLNILKIDLHFY